MKINMTLKRILKNIIGKLIELIEKYELRKLVLDESDINKKIIDSIKLPKDFEVLSPNSYVKATHIHKTQPYTVYELILENNDSLECADNHLIQTKNGLKFARELTISDFVITKTGISKVKSITKLPYKLCMYDLSVDSDDHLYYTNNIVSHNTTTVSAFISWMLIFHADKNILVVANKEATAIEIVDKITSIFKGLPYFLKPGCDSFGKTGLKLENGSRVISSATTNTASIGFTIHMVLLDEFAHIAETVVNNFWRSVYPTLSSSLVSQCIITSTPNGTTNKFYDIWSGALNKTNSFVPIRTDYWEVPGHDDAWAARMKADFGEEEFAQEFELQFNINSKMLLKGSDMKFIERIYKQFVHKDIYGYNNPLLSDKHLRWHPDFDPNNIQETDKFIFLIDLAEGTGKEELKFKSAHSLKKDSDANTINIFKIVPNSMANINKYASISCEIGDAFKYIQVGVYECNTEDETYCAKVCAALCYDLLMDDIRNSVRVMVEMNFNGKGFLITMQNHPKYYDGTILKTYHTKPIPGEKIKRKFGFKTITDKEFYCIKGAKLIEKRRTIITDKTTMEQIKSFGYVKGKLAGISCHDDLSMPVFNHIPRMLNEETYISWLYEILETYPDENIKYKLNTVLKNHELEAPVMSDAEFDALYGGNIETNIFSQIPNYGQNTYYQNQGFNSYKNPYSSNY